MAPVDWAMLDPTIRRQQEEAAIWDYYNPAPTPQTSGAGQPPAWHPPMLPPGTTPPQPAFTPPGGGGPPPMGGRPPPMGGPAAPTAPTSPENPYDFNLLEKFMFSPATRGQMANARAYDQQTAAGLNPIQAGRRDLEVKRQALTRQAEGRKYATDLCSKEGVSAETVNQLAGQYPGIAENVKKGFTKPSTAIEEARWLANPEVPQGQKAAYEKIQKLQNPFESFKDIMFLDPNEKAIAGYKPNEHPYRTRQGEIKLPPKTSGDIARQQSFAGTMETAYNTIKEIYDEDPSLNYEGIQGNWEALKLAAATKGGWLGGILQGGLDERTKKLGSSFLEFIGSARGYASGADVPEKEVERDMSTYRPQGSDSRKMIDFRLQKMAERVDVIKGMEFGTPEEKRQLADQIAARDRQTFDQMNLEEQKKITAPFANSHNLDFDNYTYIVENGKLYGKRK